MTRASFLSPWLNFFYCNPFQLTFQCNLFVDCANKYLSPTNQPTHPSTCLFFQFFIVSTLIFTIFKFQIILWVKNLQLNLRIALKRSIKIHTFSKSNTLLFIIRGLLTLLLYIELTQVLKLSQRKYMKKKRNDTIR